MQREHSSSIYRSKEIASTLRDDFADTCSARIRAAFRFTREEEQRDCRPRAPINLSINNPARRERIVAREEGNARAKVRKARYLNSSEAERRTNKASGDKYSTSLGKLRQSRVYEPLSLYSPLTATLVRHSALVPANETAP